MGSKPSSGLSPRSVGVNPGPVSVGRAARVEVLPATAE